jgi:transcriptional regulator with XRE-family HTH domain
MDAAQNGPDGENIRELRQLLGWTQFDLSRATDIDRSKLSLAENGHVVLRPDELHLIEEAVRLGAEKRFAQLEALLIAVGAEGNPRKEQRR